VLSLDIDIEGLRVTLIDTAGLHETSDELEQEGIRRALDEASRADLLLCLYDAAQARPSPAALLGDTPGPRAILHVRSKIDLHPERPAPVVDGDTPEVHISAHTGQGLDALRTEILRMSGVCLETDSPLLARARHLYALDSAVSLLDFDASAEMTGDAAACAERLRLAHRAVGELTGEFTSEDLLGEIFTRFCIGK
jgi:tRNA modification GTPase